MARASLYYFLQNFNCRVIVFHLQVQLTQSVQYVLVGAFRTFVSLLQIGPRHWEFLSVKEYLSSVEWRSDALGGTIVGLFDPEQRKKKGGKRH